MIITSALLIKLLIGAVLSLVITITGVGGGVLILPVLMYLFGLDPLSAVATANFLSMLMKVPSSLLHLQMGNIPLKRGMIILAIMLPSTFGASFGITLLASVTAWHNQVQFVINGLIVLTIAASLLVFCRRFFYRRRVSYEQRQSSAAGLRYFIIPGLLAGIILGATGVGGGILLLPLLMNYADMNIKHAVGTSIFITLLLSGASAFAYGVGGYTNVNLAFILACGSLLSLPLARYLMKTLTERMTQGLTLLFIIASALLMLYRLFIS